MKIYHYHPDSGIYIGDSLATSDPLESEKYLIPANSTTKSPPADIDGYVLVFKNQKWIYVEDFRGTTVYRKDDGSAAVINSIGPIPTEFTIEGPPSPRHYMMSGQWHLPDITLDEVRAYRNRLLDDTVTLHLRATRETRMGIIPTIPINKIDEYCAVLANITEGLDLTGVKSIEDINWPEPIISNNNQPII